MNKELYINRTACPQLHPSPEIARCVSEVEAAPAHNTSFDCGVIANEVCDSPGSDQKMLGTPDGESWAGAGRWLVEWWIVIGNVLGGLGDSEILD